jgi:hypothetical protein
MTQPRKSSAAFAPSRLCVERNRRAFLNNLGMGFAGLAMGSLLTRDGFVRAGETNREALFDRRASRSPKASRSSGSSSSAG